VEEGGCDPARRTESTNTLACDKLAEIRKGRELSSMKTVIAAALALVVGLLAFASAAPAQTWLGTPGVTGIETAEVGDARLTLPPGKWELLGDVGQGSNAMNAITWKTRVYLQESDGRVGTFLVIGSNESAPTSTRSHWSVPGLCGLKTGKGMIADPRNVDYGAGTFDCLVASFVNPGDPTDSPLWRKMSKRAQSLGDLPPALAYIVFNMTSASHRDSLVVELFVNPATPSFHGAVWGAATPSSPEAAVDDILRVMTAWAQAYRPTVAASLP